MSDLFIATDDTAPDYTGSNPSASDGGLSASLYNVQPTPGAMGPNAVTVAGDQYLVTPDNYSTLARMYIDNQNANGSQQYNANTYQGQQSIIAVSNAFRELAGLPTTTQTQVAPGIYVNPVVDTSNAVLSNPLIATVDNISSASNQVFRGLSSITSGIANTAGQIGNVGGILGNLLQGVGGLIVLGIVGYLIYKKVVK